MIKQIEKKQLENWDTVGKGKGGKLQPEEDEKALLLLLSPFYLHLRNPAGQMNGQKSFLKDFFFFYSTNSGMLIEQIDHMCGIRLGH